jgi:hypothetical protein
MYSLYQDYYAFLYSFSQDLFNHLYSFSRTSQPLRRCLERCIKTEQFLYQKRTGSYISRSYYPVNHSHCFRHIIGGSLIHNLLKNKEGVIR